MNLQKLFKTAGAMIRPSKAAPYQPSSIAVQPQPEVVPAVVECNPQIDPPAALGGSLTAEEPCRISSGVFSGSCSIGAFSYVNYGTEVADTTIGRYCSIGQRVLIGPGMHPIDMVTTHPLASDLSGISAGLSQYEIYKAFAFNAYTKMGAATPGVVIGHDVWIGANAIIMRGVTIGHGAIVGAAAVVTKDVEPYSIVVGSPARHVRYRFDDRLKARLMASNWWDYDLSLMIDRDYSQPDEFLNCLEAVPEKSLYNPRVKEFRS